MAHAASDGQNPLDAALAMKRAGLHPKPVSTATYTHLTAPGTGEMSWMGSFKGHFAPLDGVRYMKSYDEATQRADKISIAICVPFFNEDSGELERTLGSLWRQQMEFRKHDVPVELHILLLMDGWEKASESMREYVQFMFPARHRFEAHDEEGKRINVHADEQLQSIGEQNQSEAAQSLFRQASGHRLMSPNPLDATTPTSRTPNRAAWGPSTPAGHMHSTSLSSEGSSEEQELNDRVWGGYMTPTAVKQGRYRYRYRNALTQPSPAEHIVALPTGSPEGDVLKPANPEDLDNRHRMGSSASTGVGGSDAVMTHEDKFDEAQAAAEKKKKAEMDAELEARAAMKAAFMKEYTVASDEAWGDHIKPMMPGPASKSVETFFVQKLSAGGVCPVGVSYTDPKQELFVTLCVKRDNRRKHNSHEWFFNAYASQLNPDLAFLTDCGTIFDDDCLYVLVRHLQRNPMTVGVTGRMRTMTREMQGVADEIAEFSFQGWLRAVQSYDFETAYIIYTTAFNTCGLLPVMPGPCQLFRYKALLGAPLEFYFRMVNQTAEEGGMVIGNLLLAEDRILSEAVVLLTDQPYVTQWEPEATFYFDPEPCTMKMVTQRRRWNNGAVAGFIFVLWMFPRMIWKSDHPFKRRFFMHTLFIVLFLAFALLTLSPVFVITILHSSMTLLSRLWPEHIGWLESQGWTYMMAVVQIFFYIGWTFVHLKAKYIDWLFKVAVANSAFFIVMVFGTITMAMILAYQRSGQSPEIWIILPGFLLVAPIPLAMLAGYKSSFKMARTFVPYLMFLPMMLVYMPSYSMARLHDLSWGNRPSEGGQVDEEAAKAAAAAAAAEAGTGSHSAASSHSHEAGPAEGSGEGVGVPAAVGEVVTVGPAPISGATVAASPDKKKKKKDSKKKKKKKSAEKKVLTQEEFAAMLFRQSLWLNIALVGVNIALSIYWVFIDQAAGQTALQGSMVAVALFSITMMLISLRYFAIYHFKRTMDCCQRNSCLERVRKRYREEEALSKKVTGLQLQIGGSDPSLWVNEGKHEKRLKLWKLKRIHANRLARITPYEIQMDAGGLSDTTDSNSDYSYESDGDRHELGGYSKEVRNVNQQAVEAAWQEYRRKRYEMEMPDDMPIHPGAPDIDGADFMYPARDSDTSTLPAPMLLSMLEASDDPRECYERLTRMAGKARTTSKAVALARSWRLTLGPKPGSRRTPARGGGGYANRAPSVMGSVASKYNSQISLPTSPYAQSRQSQHGGAHQSQSRNGFEHPDDMSNMSIDGDAAAAHVDQLSIEEEMLHNAVNTANNAPKVAALMSPRSGLMGADREVALRQAREAVQETQMRLLKTDAESPRFAMSTAASRGRSLQVAAEGVVSRRSKSRMAMSVGSRSCYGNEDSEEDEEEAYGERAERCRSRGSRASSGPRSKAVRSPGSRGAPGARLSASYMGSAMRRTNSVGDGLRVSKSMDGHYSSPQSHRSVHSRPRSTDRHSALSGAEQSYEGSASDCGEGMDRRALVQPREMAEQMTLTKPYHASGRSSAMSGRSSVGSGAVFMTPRTPGSRRSHIVLNNTPTLADSAHGYRSADSVTGGREQGEAQVFRFDDADYSDDDLGHGVGSNSGSMATPRLNERTLRMFDQSHDAGHDGEGIAASWGGGDEGEVRVSNPLAAAMAMGGGGATGPRSVRSRRAGQTQSRSSVKSKGKSKVKRSRSRGKASKASGSKSSKAGGSRSRGPQSTFGRERV